MGLNKECLRIRADAFPASRENISPRSFRLQSNPMTASCAGFSVFPMGIVLLFSLMMIGQWPTLRNIPNVIEPFSSMPLVFDCDNWVESIPCQLPRAPMWPFSNAFLPDAVPRSQSMRSTPVARSVVGCSTSPTTGIALDLHPRFIFL